MIKGLGLNRWLPGRTVTILSVDGGGIRGYLAALILKDLEKRREAMGKKRPLHKAFDLMAGTSTGSLISLGLALPEFTGDSVENTGNSPEFQGLIHNLFTRPTPKFRASDLADLYRKRGTEIFPRRIFQQLNTVRQAFVEKYDSGNFNRVLVDNFGDVRMSQLLSRVLITSYDTLSGRPLIIKNLPGEEDFFVRDVARGSSSAPSYFEPAEIRSLDTDQAFCLVDGGVFANNPAMCAYVEARRLFPLARRFFILSLGSGDMQLSYSYKRMKDWGYLEWVLPSNGVPLISMMSSGQNRCVDYQLEHLPAVSYLRLNPSLEGCSEEMDDAGDKNMMALERAASRCIEQHDGTLSRIARYL